LRQLHAMVGSSNAGERENAWKKVVAWLRKHGKTWNDLPELLHDETAPSRTDPRAMSRRSISFAHFCKTMSRSIRMSMSPPRYGRSTRMCSTSSW